MEKYRHPIDDYFREALKDYTPAPSAESREAFLKKASDLSRSGNRRIWLWFLLVPLLLLVGVAVGTYRWQTLSEKARQIISSPPGPHQTTSPSSVVILPENPASPAPIQPQQRIAGAETPYLTTQGIPSAVTKETAEEPVVPEIRQEQDSVKAVVQDFLKDATDNFSPAADSVPSVKDQAPADFRHRGISLAAGIYYSPEWMFNTLEGDKFVHNAGLEGIFRFGRYSVRTGVGVSVTKGTRELSIRYNEYLGSFKALDSITFKWDEQQALFLPTIYLTDKDVWDSLLLEEEHAVVRRYTYLQIPVILGYDFLERGRFSMGVRAGPVLSVLLSSKQLTANYDPGKDKIIVINQITPDRIQINWQAMAGLNFAYSLNRNCIIELEPEARYYFNSVYEKSDITRKPWSVGIRAAVHFNFELKK